MKGIQITAGFLLAGGAQCDHLWNLNKDPTESTDLFNDASYDDIKKVKFISFNGNFDNLCYMSEQFSDFYNFL